jgi:hypothetical protein
MTLYTGFYKGRFILLNIKLATIHFWRQISHKHCSRILLEAYLQVTGCDRVISGKHVSPDVYEKGHGFFPDCGASNILYKLLMYIKSKTIALETWTGP